MHCDACIHMTNKCPLVSYSWYFCTDEDTRSFKTVSSKFHRLFHMPQEEKLVNYYSCSYWKGRMPRQGWLYLSMNHLCFYAYILGKETKLIVRWTDVTELDKTSSLLFPDSIRIATREKQVGVCCQEFDC